MKDVVLYQKTDDIQYDMSQTKKKTKIELIPEKFSVCKVSDYSGIDIDQPFVFTGRTDEEKSLVCPTRLVPGNTESREDGWRAFRIPGTLDFSLVGILADIAGLLASSQISIFAISTYNTDYILTKEKDYQEAVKVLASSGFVIC